jgi:hypothetical protein
MEYKLFDSSTVRVFYIFIMLMIGFYFIQQKERTGTYMHYDQ